MNMGNLYSAGFDFPEYAGKPKQIYMVASVPRSGSTYFLRRLWARGVFGAPLEYMNPKMNERIAQRLGAGDFNKYWENVQKFRTSSNGVFGFKMFIGNYITLLEERPEFLHQFEPDHVLYYTRADKVAQAVSYARAVITERWFSHVSEVRPPEYNFDTIYEMELAIRIQEAKWERIFELGNADPLRLEYSQILSDEDSVISRIAEYMSLDLDPSALIDVRRLEKQGDELNLEWAENYRIEKISRGVIDPEHRPEVLLVTDG